MGGSWHAAADCSGNQNDIELAVVLDDDGNAVGGVRTPFVDVPVATLAGVGNTPGFCSLFGTTVPFTQAKLSSLYKSHSAFVAKWTNR